MSFRVIFDASQSIIIILACDPAVQQENSPRLLRAYMASGKAPGLKIPEDAARVQIRPITPKDEEVARLQAGPLSFVGQRVWQRMEEDLQLKELKRLAALSTARVTQAQAELLEDGEPLDEQAEAALILSGFRDAFGLSLGQIHSKAQVLALLARGPGLEIPEEGESLAQLREEQAQHQSAVHDHIARWLDALPDDERQAAFSYEDWLERKSRALVSLCTLSFDDDESFKADPLAFFESIDPPDLAAEVMAELMIHIRRISTWGEAGKARYAWLSGSAPRDQESAEVMDGPVRTAEETQPCGESEGAAV